MNETRLREIEGRAGKATDAIVAATKNGCRFTVSIPVRRELDLDCLVVDCCADNRALTAEVRRLVAVLREIAAAKHSAEYRTVMAKEALAPYGEIK